jgi:hypothetical protein
VRWVWVLSLLAAATIAAGSTLVSAAMAPQHQCGGPIPGKAWSAPGRSGKHYLVFVIGTSYQCALAGKWTLKLVQDQVKGSFGDADQLRNGPHGYHCVGDVDNENYAYAGFCIKGAQTNPTGGFTWSGSNG